MLMFANARMQVALLLVEQACTWAQAILNLPKEESAQQMLLILCCGSCAGLLLPNG
jgi:hypothetical protein